jgi:hypothetical protein
VRTRADWKFQNRERTIAWPPELVKDRHLLGDGPGSTDSGHGLVPACRDLVEDPGDRLEQCGVVPGHAPSIASMRATTVCATFSSTVFSAKAYHTMAALPFR